jgi:subtilisin family serine protease
MAIRTDSVPTTPGQTSGNFFTDDIARATTYAVTNGASVINYSLGGEGVMPIGLAAALSDAAASDVILVAAAGNNGKDTVTNLLAMWVTSTDATGHGIAVGSVSANNQISSFSNKAGDSANFYIVAPGEAIRAIDNVGDAVTGTGTSISAPHVSGAAALLKQAFPHLTGKQIVDLILRTATDLGAPGTDPVYGRGLLNIAAAMAPVGTASIPTETNVGGASVPLGTSSLRLGAAFGDALASNGALKNSIMLDDYQRAYTVDLTSRVARPQPQHDLVNWLGGGKNYDFVAAPIGTAGQASFSERTTDRRTVEPTRQGSGRSFSFTS